MAACSEPDLRVGHTVNKSMCVMLRLDLLLRGCLTWCGGSRQRVKAPRTLSTCLLFWGLLWGPSGVCNHGRDRLLPHFVLDTQSAPAQMCLLQGRLRQAGSLQISSADSPAEAGAVQVRASSA